MHHTCSSVLCTFAADFSHKLYLYSRQHFCNDAFILKFLSRGSLKGWCIQHERYFADEQLESMMEDMELASTMYHGVDDMGRSLIHKHAHI